jgi:5'-nucleotidase
MPIDALDRSCEIGDSKYATCVGGLARRKTAIDKVRREKEHVLLLDAGDQFQGSLFYTKYKGHEARRFMNELNYTAMTFGNHEFDDGPEVLGKFVRGLHFPIVSANVDVSREPALANLVRPYIIVTLSGYKVAITGYTTEETAFISSPGPNVIFNPIEESLRKVVQEIHKEGVRIIIALSHAGYPRDREVASSVDGVKLIVAAHTNTLLSNTQKNAEGPYPVVIKSPSGKPVLIVSAYAYGKYLGDIDLLFDPNEALTEWEGEPLFLSNNLEPDEQFIKAIDEMRLPLEAMRHEVVGTLKQPLVGRRQSCSASECSFGNFMADALVEIAAPYGTTIGMINAGAFRTDLSAGPITRWQLMECLPFENQIDVIELSGKGIRRMLEHSVGLAKGTVAYEHGGFLQVSGLQFTLNPDRPAGKRVDKIAVFDSKKKQYRPMTDAKLYAVALSRFIREGGDGFDMLKGAKDVMRMSETLQDAAIQFMNKGAIVTRDAGKSKAKRITRNDR